ncbi:unnamed protein product [Rhizoctonia solani]|uniref:Methyltransferase domain-containing protein n=1 Tax=Rhizoctonia solani TaxID=456999 RepID=A0A8H3A279_9AGAM|nr:unnamed protein product [Rhizoctonia solani]
MNSEQQDSLMSDTASNLSRLIDDTETTPSMTNDGCTDTGTEGRVSPAPSLYSLTPSLRDQSFRHVHGRSLNAHSDVYSLPADEEEAQRLYRQHRLFYLLARDDHYYGMTDLVKEVLAPTEERQRMVLDLGCGPGAWTIQCATDFPHVEVLGVDLAPTSAIVPPQNCRFEIDDLNLGLEHFFGPTFDIVHARLLNSGVKDYAGLVDQVSRCLRPGGLVIFAEFDFRIWAEDHRLLIPPNFYTPLPTQGNTQPSLAPGSGSAAGLGSSGRTSANASKVSTVLTKWAVPIWMATMSKCVRAKGGNIDAAALLKTWLREHPNYEDVQPRDLWAPLGPWKATQPNNWTQHPNFPATGEMSRDNLINLMRGARPLLYGWFSPEEVAALEEAALQELQAETNQMYIRVQVTTGQTMSQHVQVDLSIGTLFGIKGKIALVTGGGSGIGFMIASALVQNGAKVYIASRKEKQLQEAQKALNEKGPGRCEYIVADLGSKAGCEALCGAFKARESKLHILVNNSGATWGAPWEDFPEKEGWDRVMALNVKSLFYMTSGLSELLQKDATALDPGRVVNISSVAGKDPIAHDTGLASKGQGLWSYNTSKAAVNHLTTTMAVTLAPKFVTCEPSTLSTRPQLPYVEIAAESPVPSTLVASPAPTLGRSPSPSPPEMASLYSRFRASRNSLSVSDLVGPVWCEVQFDYGLRGKRYLPPSLRPKVVETRSGKKIPVQQEVAIKNDRVLKKGTAVHKKLEREIRPIEVEITPNTREDTWGLNASFSPSFLQESAALVLSNGLGPEAENAVCLDDLENVWNTTVSELVRAVDPGVHDSMVSNVLKLVYRRRGTSKKRSAYAGESTQEPRRASSPETQCNEQTQSKKGRAESEDVELQRAIHESLRHSERTIEFTLQDETTEVMGRQRQDESQELMQETGSPVRVPGGWISPEDDMQRAIDESKKSYHKQTGGEVVPLSPPSLALDAKRKREDHKGVIGVVEFEHDGALLDTHLSSVLDFWHDRRAPRGVDLEDTGRCRYCEFSEGCEWLEAKAKEIAQELSKRK